MLMLEVFEGRGFEEPEVEHSCDTSCTEVVHFHNEMFQVVEYMDDLVKQNYKYIIN